MQLYSFFNSSAAWRVRIALALKGLAFETCGVNLRQGQQRGAAYLALNASGSVPLLVEDAGQAIGQSLAIIDYLDQRFAQVRMLPLEPLARARVLEVANLICCDIHPLNNLRVLGYLQNTLRLSDPQKQAWYRHWVEEGFQALEAVLARHGHGAYCFGDTPGLAECCLVPQVGNALRMGCELQRFTRTLAVYERCQAHPAFIQAMPNRQADFID
ncbi:maleylacetoacetate isomerase [Pseudomonas sp. LF245]